MKGMYKTLTDREKSFREVDSAARVYEDVAADGVAELLAPELADGEELPDLRQLQRLACSALRRRYHRLDQAGEGLIAQQTEVHFLKREVDELTASHHGLLADVRLALKGFFGKAKSENFIGLRGETSRDPVELLRQLDRAAARLLDEEWPLPPFKLAMQNIDRADQARQLAAASSALTDAYQRWIAAVKEADARLDMKNKALDDYNETFVKVAGWFAAFYTLAGREDLARKIRPSRQRKGRTIASLKIGRPRKPRAKTPAPVADIAKIAPVEPRSDSVAAPQPVPVEVVASDDDREDASLPAALEVPARASNADRSRRAVPAVHRILSFLGRDRAD